MHPEKLHSVGPRGCFQINPDQPLPVQACVVWIKREDPLKGSGFEFLQRLWAPRLHPYDFSRLNGPRMLLDLDPRRSLSGRRGVAGQEQRCCCHCAEPAPTIDLRHTVHRIHHKDAKTQRREESLRRFWLRLCQTVENPRPVKIRVPLHITDQVAINLPGALGAIKSGVKQRNQRV